MNGSLYLQVMHDRCLNCNECSIALACPTQAFSRIPACTPYRMRKIAVRTLRQLDKLPASVYVDNDEEDA